MLFDFKTFIGNLPNSISEKYFTLYGQPNKIEDCLWYNIYVDKISASSFNYKVPEELKFDFDWELLAKLAFASFSCKTELVKQHNEIIELYITVWSDAKSVTKKVSELWSFQINILFEIFIKEQIELAIISKENPEERFAIDYQKFLKLQMAKLVSEKPLNILNLPINLN